MGPLIRPVDLAQKVGEYQAPIPSCRPSTSRRKEDIQDETILTEFSIDVGHYIGQTIDDHTKRILLE